MPHSETLAATPSDAAFRGAENELADGRRARAQARQRARKARLGWAGRRGGRAQAELPVDAGDAPVAVRDGTQTPSGRAYRPEAVGRRARVGILAPGSSAERASRGLVWVLAWAGLAAALCFPTAQVMRFAGAAAPLVVVLAGYGWSAGLRPRTVMARTWTRQLRPYLVWLVLIGAPVVAVEAQRAGAFRDGWSSAVSAATWQPGSPLRDRAMSLLTGGLDLAPPLSGHWVLGAIIVAGILARLAEHFLAVNPVWLLPAALALTAGAPALVGVPAALGLGAVMVTFLLVGHWLRLVREYVGWGVGLALISLGVSAWLALAGPLDLVEGVSGMAVAGPLSVAVAGAGVILVAERVAGALPSGVVGVFAAVDRLSLVALLTVGLGVYVVAPEWAGWGALGASVAIAVGVCALVGLLPRSSWLTGDDAPGPVWRLRRRAR